MKAEELIGKSQDELKKMLLDLKKQQFNFRFQLAQGQLENSAQVRKTRRDIARVKTFMNMPEAAKVSAPKKAVAKKTVEKAAPKKKAAAKKSA